MTRITAFALLYALTAAAASAERPVLNRAGATALNSQVGAQALGSEAAREHARTGFEGRDRATPVMAGKVSYQGSGLAVSELADGRAVTVPGPQLPAAEEGKRKKGIPDWASYAAGGALGALQGALSYGLMGALGGAALGLGVSYLYTKGHYAAAIGASAGSIIGGAVGGPLGAIAGALLGGILGHFIGKLFG